MLRTPLKAMAQMSMMDNVFWAMWDSPLDVIIGYPDPDPEKQMKNVITTKDGKLHLFDETADRFIRELITVEKEREATAPSEEYPDLMSSGLHSDDGDNNTMRNNDTYRYRKPFKLFMSPVEAGKKGIKDGEVVRVSTKAGSVDIPVEYEWKMAEGYCMMPHHMGLKNVNQPLYGDTANRIMSHEDYDEITTDPLIRYVPCRIDKIDA
jgi:anaerobic selenocysteine-containing dehydrogenase